MKVVGYYLVRFCVGVGDVAGELPAHDGVRPEGKRLRVLIAGLGLEGAPVYRPAVEPRRGTGF